MTSYDHFIRLLVLIGFLIGGLLLTTLFSGLLMLGSSLSFSFNLVRPVSYTHLDVYKRQAQLPLLGRMTPILFKNKKALARVTSCLVALPIAQ